MQGRIFFRYDPEHFIGNPAGLEELSRIEGELAIKGSGSTKNATMPQDVSGIERQDAWQYVSARSKSSHCFAHGCRREFDPFNRTSYGVNRNTIMSLLVLAGEKCERMMETYLRKVKVSDVQADEIWNFVRMKEKTQSAQGPREHYLGDAYTFVAFESNTKLVITWHLGRRTAAHTQAFAQKLFNAVDGTDNRFQITTAGLASYPDDQLCVGNEKRLRDVA